ncbi:MAG: hypothetical protein K8S27_05595 [Candidatus Omnitrophica bacterium]|nr:hypothetical protein [Candidatus Omnitrophota bacterium]
MKTRHKLQLLTIYLTVFVFFIANISSASEQAKTIEQQLCDRISFEIEEIQQSKKKAMPEFISPAIHMTQKEWKNILNEQQKKLNNLLMLIRKTPEERIPDVLAEHFLHEKNYFGQYPPLEPYILALGEKIIPPFSEQYDKVEPRIRERMLVILGNTYSRKALPIVRKAFDDPNQRVILFAQTALRLILNLEAKPELEKMLIETKSSWALKHTLREISIIGGKDWYNDFFRLAKSRKISLSDLALIGNPEDCPQAVISENLNFLMNIIIADKEPDIWSSDIHSLGEFLILFKDLTKEKNALLNAVVSNFAPPLLSSLAGVKDATELNGQDEKEIVSAFNKAKDNLWLFPENVSEIELKNPILKNMLGHLQEKKIFMRTSTGNWVVKDPLSREEQEAVEWFNIFILNQEFPLTLSKDKYGNNEKYIARRVLLKLDQRNDLRKLYPLLTKILHDRYGWGGKTEGFSSRVTRLSDNIEGFRDDEADRLLKKFASNLEVEDIKEWLKQDSSDSLTNLYCTDLLAAKTGNEVDSGQKVFSFRIKVMDQSNNILASSEFQFRLGEEQSIVLPSQNARFPDHNIRLLKAQLDHSTWMFHIESLFIDLKPHGVVFDIDIPFAGSNETPLIESLEGQREKVIWRFEHGIKD